MEKLQRQPVLKPSGTVTPESEEEIASLVKKASRSRKKISVVGAGHSSSPLVETNGLLISLQHFKEVESPDLHKNQATVLAGTL